MRGSILLVGLFCASGAIAAKPKPEHKARRFVLRELRLEGSISDADKKKLQERVRDGVELIVSDRGDELVHAEDEMAALAEHPTVRDCFEPRCTLELGDALKAARVLSVRVERSGPPGDKGEWTAHVSQFAIDQMRGLGSLDVPCHACSADELLGDLTNSVEQLLKADVQLPLCTLKVASRPPGAQVAIETTPVGQTPFSHSIAAGRHTVSVERPGFARGDAEVDCQAGTVESAVFALTEKSTSLVKNEEHERPHRSPALKIVGGSLVVLGVAGVVAGAANLAINGKGTCDLGDGHTQCPKVYDTGAVGGALVGVGAAALVGGVVALVVDAHRARPRRVEADVRVGPGAAAVGVRGSF